MALFENSMYAKDMSLSTMTEGISVEGMRDLKDGIYQKLVVAVGNKLSETKGIENAIRANWQGEARDIFLQNFAKSISAVKQDINAEYNDLLRKLGELLDNYFLEDKKMVDLVSK